MQQLVMFSFALECDFLMGNNTPMSTRHPDCTDRCTLEHLGPLHHTGVALFSVIISCSRNVVSNAMDSHFDRCVFFFIIEYIFFKLTALSSWWSEGRCCPDGYVETWHPAGADHPLERAKLGLAGDDNDGEALD